MVGYFSCAVLLRLTDERDGCYVLRAGGNLRVVESGAGSRVLIPTKSAWCSDRDSTLCARYAVICFVAKTRAAALNRSVRSRPRNVRCPADAATCVIDVSAAVTAPRWNDWPLLHALCYGRNRQSNCIARVSARCGGLWIMVLEPSRSELNSGICGMVATRRLGTRAVPTKLRERRFCARSLHVFAVDRLCDSGCFRPAPFAVIQTLECTGGAAIRSAGVVWRLRLCISCPTGLLGKRSARAYAWSIAVSGQSLRFGRSGERVKTE